ncbi:uncharacterized protein [Onthophagus taurus]|uniref:uncharacterized protein n=1 Tax=Onthophagus taurus TaxID=166361 RepID=UPI0039BDD48B
MFLNKIVIVFVFVSLVNTQGDGNRCEGQEDYYTLDESDPCSCWCLNQEVVCNDCVTDTESPETTTYSIGGICDENKIYAIDRYDPCTCWCGDEGLICPVCTTLVPDTDEFTQSNECVGQEDHKINPDDKCSCWCLGENLVCPECNMN